MYIYLGNLRFPVIQGEMNFDSSFFLVELCYVERCKKQIDCYRIEGIDIATKLENIRLFFLFVISILIVDKLIENEKNNTICYHC